jgi:transcription initiation factor TFIIIB Brf1 subunit/transcription initiation factor TFIIB
MANNAACKECKGRCVYTDTDLTCTECGLEQGEFILVPEFNVHERVAIMEPFKEPLKKRLDIFERTQESLCMPDNVAEIARGVYNAFQDRKPIKGEKRNLELICASFLYASRVMNSGALTHQKIIDSVPEARGFQWAVKEMPQVLANSDSFTRLFDTQGATIDDAISRMLALVLKDIKLFKGQDLNRKLRPTIHKLKDMVKGDPACDLIIVDKINATLILMACKIHKAPMTMKRISALLNVSEPTLLKIEKLIQKVVEKKRA